MRATLPDAGFIGPRTCTRCKRERMGTDQNIRADGQSLTTRAIGEIETFIFDKRLAPGDRLPTVRELARQIGVSLTVVREAIASLKANGIVNTRQGAGIFVSDGVRSTGAHQLSGDFSRISNIVESLELRMAVEIKVAGLAAERRSMAQEMRIHEAFAKMEDALKVGVSSVRADFDFHMSIAEAANNHYFVDFLTYLGKAMIPRRNVRLVPASGEGRTAYLKMLQAEHRQILAAISNGDPDTARAAMRAHLSESRLRYLALLTKDRTKTS